MSLSFQLSHAAAASVDTPLLAVILPQDASMQTPALADALGGLDALVHGAIGRSLARRDFRAGATKRCCWSEETGVQRLLLVGRGSAPLTRTTARRAAAIAARQATKLGTGAITLLLPTTPPPMAVSSKVW